MSRLPSAGRAYGINHTRPIQARDVHLIPANEPLPQDERAAPAEPEQTDDYLDALRREGAI
jgi:hypothetical protein